MLIDLWNVDRRQIDGKRIDQLISFAGQGRLLDGNETSVEFRRLLEVVDSDLIKNWLSSCLEIRFTDFGFVLQDIVNQIGRRIGFKVEDGVYRGNATEGYDGLWQHPGGKALLVEVKSSTAYSINLNRISEYRKQIAPRLGIAPDDISVLFVVGSEDTSEFEAQVRGSRLAWDIRILGMSSLLRLLQLKESIDDPNVAKKIQDVLFPQEFTRLDGIIDLVFATTEDAIFGDADEEQGFGEGIESPQDALQVAPCRVSFHSAIIARLEKYFGQPLVRRSRVLWSTPDDDIGVTCQASKEFSRSDMNFWFGFKPSNADALSRYPNSFCAFGLGSASRVVLLPYETIQSNLDGLFTSPDSNGGVRHWHIRFINVTDGTALLTQRDRDRIDMNGYVLH